MVPHHAAPIVHQPDQLPELASISVPVLGIVGEQDTGFLGPVRDIVAVIAGAELVVVPDAGHSPQFENPPVWQQALDTFLARLPR